jgi:hypothetical protein
LWEVIEQTVLWVDERIALKSSFETHLRQLMIEELQNLAPKHRRLGLNLNPQKMISILAPRRVVV